MATIEPVIRRSGLVNGIHDHEKDHRKEGEQRLSVMHRCPEHVAGEEKLDQRDEVEDHAQAGGVQRDAAEKVAGAGEREEGVDQPDKVATQCEAQPKQCHKLGKYQSAEFNASWAPCCSSGNPIPTCIIFCAGESA